MTFKNPLTLPVIITALERGEWPTLYAARGQGVPWEKLQTRTGVTALGKAIADHNLSVVEHLLELGAPVTPTRLSDGHYYVPIVDAVKRKQADMVRLLLRAGADPDTTWTENDKTVSLLIHASQAGDEATTCVLCEEGANPNSAPPDTEVKADGPAVQAWVTFLLQAQGEVDIVRGWRALQCLVTSGVMITQHLESLIQHALTQITPEIQTQHEALIRTVLSGLTLDLITTQLVQAKPLQHQQDTQGQTERKRL